MATLFSTTNRISPTHISNVFTTADKPNPAGFLAKGTTQGIKSYNDLDSLADDFAAYTPVWKKGRAFFSASKEAAAFTVVTFVPGQVEAVAPSPVVSQPASGDGKTDGTSAQTAPVTTPVTPTSALSADAIGAVTALKKYYYAGPSFWALAEFDDGVAQAVSNFVELQNTGVFILFSTDSTKLHTYADNKRTMLLTLPAVDDTTPEMQDQYNNVLDAAFIGAMYGRKPHASVKYALGDLPYVKPQDRFDFTPDDVTALEKFNIGTYAFVNSSPRMTSSRMAANDVHIDTILGWDWIQNEINSRVANMFIQNADAGISYDDKGFDSIVNAIKTAFLDAYDLDIIAPLLDANGGNTGKPDYEVTYLNPGQLPKSYETKRELRGIKTKYHPMGMVEDAYIENTIVM